MPGTGRAALRRLTAVATGTVLLASGLAVAPAASADRVDTLLTVGERLERGDSLVSPGGRVALRLDAGGTLAVVERGSWLNGNAQIVRPQATAVAYVVMQGDGNLVAYRADGSPAFHAGSQGTGATSARVQEDRNVVLTRADGRVVDDLGTHLHDVLTEGTVLLPGDRVSASTPFRPSSTLEMQPDGNLVLYRLPGVAAWSSRTQGNPGAGAVFQDDGNLVVYSSAATGRRVLFNSGTAQPAGSSDLVLEIEDREISIRQTAPPAIAFPLWASGWSSNTLESDDELDRGDARRSPSGRYLLVSDGFGLVLFDRARSGDDSVAWTSPIPTPVSREGRAETRMQEDGNLVHYRFDESSGRVLDVPFQTGTRGFGSRLVVQDDGNVVVYTPDGRPTWSQLTGRIG